ETARRPDGQPVAGDDPHFVDSFGHAYHDSPAQALAALVQTRLGLRARYDRPGTIQRMSAALASTVDLDEAYRAGRAAVAAAAAGATDRIAVLRREEPYHSAVDLAPLAAIANRERLLPAELWDAEAQLPSPAFTAYAAPLIDRKS